MRFEKWLDTFIEEKRLNLDEVIEVNDGENLHIFDLRRIVDELKVCPKFIRDKVKRAIVRLDFCNAPIMPYFEHLAKSLVIALMKRSNTEQETQL